MAGRVLRGAVVGASTLLGKELAEELNNSALATWDISLLDTAESDGQITAAGDEALVIQPISAEAFSGVDVVFFTEASTAKLHWQLAHTAGASIVDLSGALEGLPQTIVRSPWVAQKGGPDLATVAVIAAHPVAVMLALVAQRLAPLGVQRVAATVLEPASEQGSEGVDELHQQTVGLLSFQPLQKDLYDSQVAFSLRASLGGAAKFDLQKTASMIDRQLVALASKDAIAKIVFQLLHAPVFHGYTASVLVELSAESDAAKVRTALQGGVINTEIDDDLPSNESVAGKGELQVSVRQASATDASVYWLWMAADNLRLYVCNAVACAVELAANRPASGLN